MLELLEVYPPSHLPSQGRLLGDVLGDPRVTEVFVEETMLTVKNQ